MQRLIAVAFLLTTALTTAGSATNFDLSPAGIEEGQIQGQGTLATYKVPQSPDGYHPYPLVVMHTDGHSRWHDESEISWEQFFVAMGYPVFDVTIPDDREDEELLRSRATSAAVIRYVFERFRKPVVILAVGSTTPMALLWAEHQADAIGALIALDPDAPGDPNGCQEGPNRPDLSRVPMLIVNGTDQHAASACMEANLRKSGVEVRSTSVADRGLLVAVRLERMLAPLVDSLTKPRG